MPALKPKVTTLQPSGLQLCGWHCRWSLPGLPSQSFTSGPFAHLDLIPRGNENCTYPLAPWWQLLLSCYLGLPRDPGDRSRGVG